MKTTLLHIENLLIHLTNYKITDFVLDTECDDYLGCSFKLNNINVKFRQAKVTPKKVGLFVTLWKRNTENKTEPFNENDLFDYYIIATKQENDFGFFIFSKEILSDKNILTNTKKEGKRGFRIYPDWTETENNQAAKTKAWQNNYFINCNKNKHLVNEKATVLLSKS